MEPIFNRHGQVVAWQKGNDLYHLNGDHAAVINERDVYGHHGQHLGVFLGGLFRDHNGGVVAFKQGASGGLILPIPVIAPIAPIPAIPPIPSIPSIAPIPAIPTLGWAQLDWEQFIGA